MSASRDDADQTAQRAWQRAARHAVAEYHEQQLRDRLEHVRDGLARLARGEIDVFDIDALIERYDLAERKLRRSAARPPPTGNAPPTCWSSCARTATRTTGGTPPRAAAAEPEARIGLAVRGAGHAK
jgi:hypothetical protein